ncbi:Fic family protein [Candidatus Micrarchaeota archaeon]|nr:Fic family protein [Candidatus Micrarchaeota archaeon]
MVNYEKATKPAEAFLDELAGPEEKEKLLAILKLAARPDVQDFIRQANDAYWTKDQLRHHPLPADVNAEELWKLCKLSRSSWNRRVLLKRSQLALSYVINDNILKRLHKLDMQLGANHFFSQPVTRTEEESFLISSLMEEAIASSQLEGAVTSREVAKQMLREGRKPRDYSQKMVANNYSTMRMIKDIARQPLTPELLLRIQASISRGTLKNPGEEGHFRTTDDVRVFDLATGEIVHTPPPAARLADLMLDLCDFANDDSVFIHPLVKASMLHFLLGYIHPFVDGNGRTARSLFYWYLVSRDCGVVEYLSISRIIRESPGQYARAYKETEDDENDATYFVLYHLRVLERSVVEFHSYLKRKAEERKQAYSLMRLPGVSPRQAQILQNILKNPEKPVSFKEIQSGFGLPYQSARLDLLQLERLNLLERKKGGKRLILFFPTSKLLSNAL